jgi:hypothetical protein
MNDYYVYAYYGYWEVAEKPFYIGKGRGRRAVCHLSAFKNSKSNCLFYQWLRQMAAGGREASVKILHFELAESEAFDKEIELITQWGRFDRGGTGCLANQTDGGGGASNPSAETRRRISEAGRHKKGKVYRNSRAVESYCLDSGRTIKTYRPASNVESDGFSRKSVINCCRGNGISHRGIGWRYVGSEHKAARASNRVATAVESYDLETGDTVKVYQTTHEVVPEGFNRGNVVNACRGRLGSYKGLGWRYVGGAPPARRTSNKAIEAFDLMTGEVLSRWPSASAAMKDGYSNVSISNACRGKLKSHKGLGWRYTK